MPRLRPPERRRRPTPQRRLCVLVCSLRTPLPRDRSSPATVNNTPLCARLRRTGKPGSVRRGGRVPGEAARRDYSDVARAARRRSGCQAEPGSTEHHGELVEPRNGLCDLDLGAASRNHMDRHPTPGRARAADRRDVAPCDGLMSGERPGLDAVLRHRDPVRAAGRRPGERRHGAQRRERSCHDLAGVAKCAARILEDRRLHGLSMRRPPSAVIHRPGDPDRLDLTCSPGTLDWGIGFDHRGG